MPTTHEAQVKLEPASLKNPQFASGLLVDQKGDNLEVISTEVVGEGDSYCIRSHSEKTFIVSVTSLVMILCMIATNAILPIMPVLASKYHLSPTLISLTITVFMLIQGISPALMSALSDLQGRRLAWVLALVLYTASNIGLALQDSYTALMILRCLQSIGSSCAIPFGFAVVVDISSPAERGRYLGPMQGCVMSAFAFGPVIGGLLAARFGWRSIFWFLATGTGCFLLVYVLVVPETARKVVGDGSIDPGAWWRKPLVDVFPDRRRISPGQHRHEKNQQKTNISQIFRAFTILKEKDALILIVYTSLVYSGISALWATTGNHFDKLYGLSTLQVGLAFLPYGIAGGIGSIVSGKLIDVNYRRISRLRAKNEENPTAEAKETQGAEFPFEVARLQVAAPFMLLVAAAYIAYGWVLQNQLPLVVPLVFQALIGVCANALLGIIYILLVDLFPEQSAATSGAADLVGVGLLPVSD
ncbi:hypothetical protein ABOM_003134 [Aspergillus bombycis]|uniref:Major facilitator superfamily (MFS) profile domain-containing protein n=1 Tax=Aspergillus bombycis TaxID=109264 RepID=A0A1F8ABA8_9EURO|nr:hypothetical protein ABOM_003134 [Aspergillus bombycis]OGM48973.1 hypothetical protein ABOM_003134 [Aspergillus bombycis]